MEQIKPVVPILSEHIQITYLKEDAYIVYQEEYDAHIRINELTYQVLMLIDGSNSIYDITEALKKQTSYDIEYDDVYSLITGKISENGLIKNNEKKTRKPKGDYLKLRITLFKQKDIYKISHLLFFLFNEKTFYKSMACMVLFIALIYSIYLEANLLYNAITPKNLLLLYASTLIATLLHELGHASACRRFGAKHGDIGFGFYLFIPVFYADVSDAWRLPSRQRIIIDMAGVYMELVVVTAFAICFMFTGNINLLILSTSIIIHTFSNLNPFIRYDAYWALSDFLDIPNLKDKAYKKVANYFFQSSKDEPVSSKQDYFLLFYGIISMMVTMAFLIVALSTNATPIIYFPFNLFYFAQEFYEIWPSITFQWLKSNIAGFIIPIMFYIIVFNLISSYILSFSVKQKEQ